MGTRCLTKVFDGAEEVCCIFRHWDGYPDGHGKDLLEMLADKRVVNGYSSAAKLPQAQRLNGPGRVAAFIVKTLFDQKRDPDILPPGTTCGEDFEYRVICPPISYDDSPPDGRPLVVECYSVRGGWGNRPRELERVPLPSERPADGEGK